MSRSSFRHLLGFAAIAAATTTTFAVAPASAGTIDCPASIINRTVDNVRVNGTCVIRNSLVKGSIEVVSGGRLMLIGSTVRGNVQAEGARQVRIGPDPAIGRDTRIIGSVQIKSMVASRLLSDVRDADINGSIQLESNKVRFNIRGNQVGADVQVFENRGLVRIADNTIDGNLQCKSNTPQPVDGRGNVVDGNAEDQCAGFDR
jgi:NDP-sugar pyrophosphorylase family protein